MVLKKWADGRILLVERVMIYFKDVVKMEDEDDWLIEKEGLTSKLHKIKHTRTYLFHEHQRDGGQQGNDCHDGKLIADRANATLQLGIRIHEFFGFIAYQQMYNKMEIKGQD